MRREDARRSAPSSVTSHGRISGLSSAGAELADVLLEPLALIGHREPGAGPRSRLRDRPRDRPLVGDADDEPVSSLSDQSFDSLHSRTCEMCASTRLNRERAEGQQKTDEGSGRTEGLASRSPLPRKLRRTKVGAGVAQPREPRPRLFPVPAAVPVAEAGAAAGPAAHRWTPLTGRTVALEASGAPGPRLALPLPCP